MSYHVKADGDKRYRQRTEERMKQSPKKTGEKDKFLAVLD